MRVWKLHFNYTSKHSRKELYEIRSSKNNISMIQESVATKGNGPTSSDSSA